MNRMFYLLYVFWLLTEGFLGLGCLRKEVSIFGAECLWRRAVLGGNGFFRGFGVSLLCVIWLMLGCTLF